MRKGSTHSLETKAKISLANVGRKRGPFTENHRRKLSEAKRRLRTNQTNNFKDEAAGYRAVHLWLNRNYGKPTKCDHCPKDGLTGHKIHWASKGDWRDRRRGAWLRLCVTCHAKYDKINGLRRSKKYERK